MAGGAACAAIEVIVLHWIVCGVADYEHTAYSVIATHMDNKHSHILARTKEMGVDKLAFMYDAALLHTEVAVQYVMDIWHERFEQELPAIVRTLASKVIRVQTMDVLREGAIVVSPADHARAFISSCVCSGVYVTRYERGHYAQDMDLRLDVSTLGCEPIVVEDGDLALALSTCADSALTQESARFSHRAERVFAQSEVQEGRMYVSYKHTSRLTMEVISAAIRTARSNRRGLNQRQRLIRKITLRREKAAFSVRELPSLQAGGEPLEELKAFDKRLLREHLQRIAAAKRAKAEAKSKPKRDREEAIRRGRDKRNPAVTGFLEPQGGRIYKHAKTTLAMAAGALLASALRGCLSRILSVAEKADDLVGTLRDIVKRLRKTLGNVLYAVPLVLSVYYAAKYSCSRGSGIGKLLSVALSGVVGKHLWERISEFFTGDSMELQSGGAQATLTKLLSVLTVFSVFKGKRTPSMVTEFVKRISLLGRVNDGWDTFVTWCVDGFETIVNQIRKCFGKDAIKLYRRQEGPVAQWLVDVEKAYNEANTDNPTVNDEILDRYILLAHHGSTFMNFYRGTPMARTIHEARERILGLLRPFQGAINARNNFRIEPEFAILTGDAGIGKSLLTTRICSAVLMNSGVPLDKMTQDWVLNNMWQKGTSEYWNGYAGQKCIIMDDAFQAKPDPTNLENDYMMIVRMVNAWSMPLNFADLESKGKIYFGSEFILATCNNNCLMHDSSICINEPRAVFRRIKHPYKIVLKSQYKDANGRLDYALYDREQCKASANGKGIDSFPWYMWELYKHDFATGQTSNEPISLKDVVIDIAHKLSRKRENFSSAKERLGDFIAALREERAAVEIEAQAGDTAFRFDQDISESTPPPYPADIRRRSVSPPEGIFAIVPTGTWAWNKIMEIAEWNATMAMVGAAMYGWVIGVTAVLVVRSICTLLKAAFTILWDFITGGKRKREPSEPVEQSNRPLTKPLRLDKGHRRMRHDDVVLQVGDPAVQAKVYRNTYKMYVESTSGDTIILGQFTFLVDVMGMQPEHFSCAIREKLACGAIEADSQIHFVNAVRPSDRFAYTVQQYLRLPRVSIPERDVEFLQCTGRRAHSNIVRNYVKEADLVYVGNKPTRLDVCEVDRAGKLCDDHEHSVFVSRVHYSTEPVRFRGRQLQRYLKYPVPTKQGDCGAPLGLYDNTHFSGRTCLGFHTAGNISERSGYSTVVTQEMIRSAQGKLQVVEDTFEEDFTARMDEIGIEHQACADFPFPTGSTMPLFRLSKGPVNCPVTSYELTRYNGVFGDYLYGPALLRPTRVGDETIWPMQNAYAPYFTPVHIHDTWPMDKALHIALRPLFERTQGDFRGILSVEEAATGIPQIKLRSLPRGTASGFPYNMTVKCGKKQFFGDGEVFDFSSPEYAQLKVRVLHVVDRARCNERCAHIFHDFLKDELRPEAKVQAGATRLISSAPLDYVLAWRMYFGAFSAAVMANNVDSGMAPGICTYTDWDKLANRLCSKGLKVFAGDFKGFDSSLQPTLLERIVHFVNRWYDDGEENARIRRILWLDLLHSRHVGGNGVDQTFVYQWNKSLPSGHPFTTILNSIYSLTMLVRVYMDLTGDQTGFWENVFSITYGDDNVSNVHDSKAEAFNQVTVAAGMAKYHMTYTSDVKDGNLVPYTNIGGVTFLKRRFLLEGNYWNCPLDLDSFLYTIYWTRNKRLENEIIYDCLENALQELSLHEPEVWLEYGPQVIRILERDFGGTKCLPERQAYLELVRSRSDSWY